MSVNPYESPNQRVATSGATTNPMSKLFILSFYIGLAFYLAAVLSVGSILGEILSDVGNAVMLSTAVLLLIRLNTNCQKSSPSEQARQDQ